MTALVAVDLKKPLVTCLAAVAAYALVASPLFAITINGESRLTEEQFARKNAQPVSDVKKTFAASGTLECRDGRRRTQLTAQLTGRNDVIVTAAHAFVDTKTCKTKMRPEQCTFKTHDGHRIVTRTIQLVAKGKMRCEPGVVKAYSDWAVLKLSAPIASIVPYDVGLPGDLARLADVFSVSAGSSDFYVGKTKRIDLKTIDTCSIRRSWRSPAGAWLLETDCDAAPGNSGGALLAPSQSGPHRLLGIVTLGPPNTREIKRDGPYKTMEWASLAVGLTSEFRAALERALGRPVSNPVASAPIFQPATATTILPVTKEKAVFPPVSREQAVVAPLLRPCEEGLAPGDCPKP